MSPNVTCYCGLRGGPCIAPGFCGKMALTPALPAPAPEPARVAGKVLGFRTWTLDGYRLLSANSRLGAYWKIGENQAECLRYRMMFISGGIPPPTHEAPHPNCECGLYALHGTEWLGAAGLDLGAMVFGAVQAWGRIEVHAQGFRAQFAAPVILAYHPRQPYEDVKAIEMIAGEMAIPVVTLDRLTETAKAFGEPVAAKLRPAPGPDPFKQRAMMMQAMQTMRPYATGGYIPPAAPVLTPPARRRAWRVGAVANGSAAVVNCGMFAFWTHSWTTLAVAAVSASFSGVFARRGWQDRHLPPR